MGCVKSRPLSVVPAAGSGPSVKSVASPPHTRSSSRGFRFLSVFTRGRGQRFTREQRQLIKKYLPSIPIYEHSTAGHREIAALHWGETYREGSMSAMSKRSQGSWGRESASKPQLSPIRELYDAFYGFLETNSPDLMFVFRASMHVRSKVLVHISAGLRSILTSADPTAKMLQLTLTHLRTGVQLEHFDPLARALFHAMAKSSGASWTPEVEHAWKRLFVHCAALLMVEQKRLIAKSKSKLNLGMLTTSMHSSPRHQQSIREQSSSGMNQSKSSIGRAAAGNGGA